MSRTALLTSAGVEAVFEEAESSDVRGTLYDASGAALAKAAIATLTATLINAADETEINSRTNQDILDANGGYVTTAGVLTLKLQPADNVIVDATTATGEVETHYIDIKWTWVDSDGDTRTGIEAKWFGVMQIA